MNTHQDDKWRTLLALSAPSFAGENALPYGLMTALLARLRLEQQEERQLGRLCWRAIFASLAALAISVGITVSVHGELNRGDDFDPGIQGLIQVEKVQAS